MFREKLKEIYWYLFLFLMFVFSGFFLHKLNLDEIWNYGFAHNIYSGLIPYRDFNMVITPFYPFLMSLGFHVFGSSLFVMYVEHAVCMVLMCYLMDKLIGKNYIVCLSIFFCSYVLMFPSYNTMLLCLYVILLYLEKNNCNDVLIGVIIALAILTKHTVGIILIIPTFYYIKSLQKIIRRLIGLIIPIVMFWGYLILTKSFQPFINLSFLGLFDFAYKNSPGLGFNHVVFIIVLIINILCVLKYRSNIINYYSLAFLSIAIPLFDYYHMCIIIISTLVMIFTNINVSLRINLYLFFIGIVLGLNVFLWYRYKDIMIYPDNINHFEYRMTDKNVIAGITNVTNYVNAKKKSGNEVVIMNGNAYYFKLIMDLPITYMDLANCGNWGHNGTNKLLKQVKSSNNILYMLDADEVNRDTQTDLAVLKYVMKNGKKVDNVWIYDVYEFD